jgi:hypothetical protein
MAQKMRRKGKKRPVPNKKAAAKGGRRGKRGPASRYR